MQPNSLQRREAQVREIVQLELARDMMAEHMRAAKEEMPSLPDESDIPPYLRCRGYSASSLDNWDDPHQPPEFTVYVSGHAEWDGHTWYKIECALKGQDLDKSWCVERRLLHLRGSLHDPLKAGLGSAYVDMFQSVPFASRGGGPGTTSQLRFWMRKLASCITGGKVPPRLTALTLCFLETPKCQPESCILDAVVAFDKHSLHASDDLQDMEPNTSQPQKDKTSADSAAQHGYMTSLRTAATHGYMTSADAAAAHGYMTSADAAATHG